MKRILMYVLVALPLMGQAQQIGKLKTKADGGDAKAMIELARHYEAGYGVEVDSAQALALLRRAEQAGNVDAAGHLSRYALYYSGMRHDSAECFRLAKASADAGSAYGMYRLGLCYIDGIGTRRDRTEGHRLMERAAAAKCAEANSFIAASYMYGNDGYAHDIELGYKYAKKVPDGLCYGRKCEMLADYYRMKGNKEEAIKWVQRGIGEGNLRAMMENARYLEMGMYGAPDERAALAEYRRLKVKMHNLPMFVMMEANMLAYANDTTLRDPQEALRLFESVGDCPYRQNYSTIANSYIYGTFTGKDSATAYRYYLRGVANRDAEAMVQLAQFFLSRDNEDSARHYARMAYAEEYAGGAQLMSQLTLDADTLAALRYAVQGADWGDENLRISAGRLYYVIGQNDKAIECFDRAIHNACYDGYFYKAMVVEDMQGWKKARKLLEEGGRHGAADCYIVIGSVCEQEEDYKQAARYYTLAATPQADYKLARLYLGGEYGDGSDDDMATGLALLRRSAAAGSRDGIYWLGIAHKQGVGCEQDFDSAAHYFNLLAEQGDGYALMQMAEAHEQGRGVQRDTALAMDYYLRAGEAGVSDGYAYLGDFYRTGTSTVAPDSARAFEYYRMAADIESTNNAAGLYYVADSYMRGIGTPIDTTAAIPYLRRAVAAGSYKSASVLGDLYNYGRGSLPQDGDSALHYYKLASQGDDPRGDYMIGAWLYDQGYYDQALQYIGSAASHGNIDAYVLYAQAMLTGNGVEQDPVSAVGMLRQLAPLNSDGHAYLLLGIAAYAGMGIEADAAQALIYFDSAASLGNTRAMMSIGEIYASGESVERDTVEALRWYERAADAGNIRAMMLLANSYRSGHNAPKNPKRAAELYQRAADRGSLEALCRLGLCYEQGEGVVLNSRKAYNLYLQAAEAGSAYGMRLVAYCYTEGIYVNEDSEQAAQWFLKAAEAGDLNSCYVIGMMYANGEGVKKNKKQAKYWLGLAADNGVEAAAQALREL